VRTRYRFRLQTVLDYRIDQVRRIQQTLAVEEHKRLQRVRRIEEYDVFIEQAFVEQQAALAAPQPDMAGAQQFPHYVLRLKQERYQEQLALQAHEQQLRTLREALKQAMIRQKSLDVLKEKGALRHRQALEKAEEAALEDLFLCRKAFTPS
jgi:flagellar export protein FliJ